jgi:hypothetical protein
MDIATLPVFIRYKIPTSDISTQCAVNAKRIKKKMLDAILMALSLAGLEAIHSSSDFIRDDNPYGDPNSNLTLT